MSDGTERLAIKTQRIDAALSPAAITSIAFVLAVAVVLILDGSLPPYIITSVDAPPSRLVWIGFDLNLVIAIASLALLWAGWAIAAGAMSASRGDRATAAAGVGLLSGVSVGAWVVACAILGDVGPRWLGLGAKVAFAIGCALLAAGSVAAGCQNGLGTRRTIAAVGWIAGVGGAIGTVLFLADPNGPIAWKPAQHLKVAEWLVVVAAIRIAIASSVVIVVVAALALAPRQRSVDDAPSAGASDRRFTARWTWLDAAHLACAFLLVVAGALVAGAVVWLGLGGQYGSFASKVLRDVSALLPTFAPAWAGGILILATVGAMAWLSASLVLRPTLRRLGGQGKTVTSSTIAALAFLVAVPGVIVVVTRVSDDYRHLLPVAVHEPLRWTLIALVVVPSLLGYLIAVRRAVAPNDPRRLTRFLAIGLVANLIVVMTVWLFDTEADGWAMYDERAIVWSVVPPFLAALAMATYTHAWVSRPLVSWHRRLCVHCGYPRHIPAGDACPECGRPWTKRREKRIRDEGSRIKDQGFRK